MINILKKIRGQTTSVGLDIGSYSIKLAKINHYKDEYHLEAVGIKELKPGIVENGDVKDKDGLIEAVTTLINQCDPSIVDVIISMSGQGMLSEKFNFKIDPNDDVEEMILWEAGQRSPFDVDDITLDYKILRRIPEKNEIEVLLVAAKNRIMQNYIDLLYEAGLKPIIVDVDAFAISNCYSLESFAEDEKGTAVLLNIGHSLTNVAFIKDGLYHSTRDITTAGDFYCKTIQRNLNVSEEKAASILKGNVDTSINMDQFQRAIEYASEELSSGIDLAFSYFKSLEKSEKIDKMVLSGGGAYIADLSKFLAERYNTTVQVSNPLAYLHHEPGLFGAIDPQKISAFMTVAVGLALRKVAD